MLNEILKDKLRVLAEDELTLQAIRVVISERIELEKPIVNEPFDDLLLGQKYRAYNQAKKILDEVLIDISTYKENKNNKEKFNKEK